MNRERVFELANNYDCGVRNENQEWHFSNPEQIIGFVALIEAELLQEQEPVAWLITPIKGVAHKALGKAVTLNKPPSKTDWYVSPLYLHPAPKEPAGWKLVPIQSTNEMDNAGACYKEVWSDMAGVIYNAMLAAAPEYKP